MAERPRWTPAQRRLHWWTVGLLGIGFPLGWVMVGMPMQELLAKFLLYQVHKTIGLLVLALVVMRLAVRARRGRPPADETLPPWQQQAASAAQAALYALLLLTPALGYFTAATAPAGVPTLFFLVLPVPHVVGPNPAWFAIIRQLHRASAILLVVLGCLHAGAALRHHRQGRPVLPAMWRG